MEFCFSLLSQEHLHSKVTGEWLCVYVSITVLFWQKKLRRSFSQHLSFQSVNSNTRVECEKCTRLIKETPARRKSIVVRLEQTLHLVWVFLWPFFDAQCGIGSISRLISWHIHNVPNRTIAKNSWQSYFKKNEVLFSRKHNWWKNLFLHFLPPLHNSNDFSSFFNCFFHILSDIFNNNTLFGTIQKTNEK